MYDCFVEIQFIYVFRFSCSQPMASYQNMTESPTFLLLTVLYYTFCRTPDNWQHLFTRCLDVQLSEQLKTRNLMFWCQFNRLKLQGRISTAPEAFNNLKKQKFINYGQISLHSLYKMHKIWVMKKKNTSWAILGFAEENTAMSRWIWSPSIWRPIKTVTFVSFSAQNSFSASATFG